MGITLPLIIIAALCLSLGARAVRSIAARQGLLLIASWLFYSAWGIGFLSVLVASSLFNFAWGRLLRRRMTSAWLWLGVSLNVGLLGLFKYVPPLMDTPSSSVAFQIVMPVGMSFWTFQALSYLFDVYREEDIEPTLIEFCLYMAFWPTVLAGPITRMPDMLPQLRNLAGFSWEDAQYGLRRVMLGVFQKAVLAQILLIGLVPGEGIADGFDRAGGWGGLDVWLLGIGFGFLLLFDFGGYSHMMIGTARLFGIRLPENFDRPFLSPTPSVFWTRWHMSLSFWIRDYVFLPLAAASRNRYWPYAVFVIAMTLFGLWHAATWTFILWGAYHGTLLVVHRIGQIGTRRMQVHAPRGLGAALSCTVTFLAVSLGWILFRATSLESALAMLGTAINPASYGRFAMPLSFYVLIAGSTATYFGYYGGRRLLSAWRDAYVQKFERPSTAEERILVSERARVRLGVGRLVNFATGTFWWWFAPTAAIITTFVGIAAYRQRVATAVPPFIYTLF